MLKAMDIVDIIVRIIADGMVVPIVLVAGWTMLRLPWQVMVERAKRGIVVGLIALWLAKICSIFYQDGERPFAAMGVDPKAAYLNNPGFPSDHVLFVVCIALVVWASTKNKPISIALFVMCALVAVGRVIALVHTPADVIGGIACAWLAASLVYGRELYTAKLPRQACSSTISKNEV